MDNEQTYSLRALLKATGHRPFFIRGSRLTPAAVERFLSRSDKPESARLLRSGFPAHDLRRAGADR